MEQKIIQLSAEKEPLEGAFVVAKVLKIFLRELMDNKIEYRVLHKESGLENGTVQRVSIQLKGNCLTDFLRNWLGTIQWIGKSNVGKFSKRKTWFIGCFERNDISAIEMNEGDVLFQAIRSSGAGGQHVNKVSSAVRAKHRPTGIQVLVTDSRSQHQNKKIALERLKHKIAKYNQRQLQQRAKDLWQNYDQIKRGNPVRVFKGTDFKSVKPQKRYKDKRNRLKNDLRKQLAKNGNSNK